jgi:serine/threonine-protein kinase
VANANTPGLPEIRPPQKIITTRERELIVALSDRATTPDKVVKWSIELGLLFVKERRLDEAEARFRKLESEHMATGPVLPKKLEPELLTARDASAAGRLGQAIVLAYRDTPQSAQASNELVVRVADAPFPKLPGKLGTGPFDRGLTQILFRHPELGLALAEALNRNAITLGKAKLEPAVLESLRSPPRAGK